MIHKKVAFRFMSLDKQSSSGLWALQTFVTEDSNKNLPSDTSKPSKYQEKYRPSEPPHRERALPIPNDFSEGRIRRTPGIPAYSGPPASDDYDKVPIRTLGKPGEEYGHPYTESVTPGRRPLNASLFPRVRQRNQRGKALMTSKRWYDQNKGPHKAKNKRNYEKKKRDPNFKRKQKLRRENPEKFERMKGRGQSDPAERSKEWREENKSAHMNIEAAGKRQRWRNPSERRDARRKYKQNKHKRRRYAKMYRRRNKSRIRQYRKRVKNLNRSRVGPKPTYKKHAIDLKNLNRFPFAFTSMESYHFGYIKEIDVDQWEVTFFLEGFGERCWDLDSFLKKVIFYRDEDLDEFFNLLDSAVEVEEEETGFDVDEEHVEEDEYTSKPIKWASYMFYIDETPPDKLDRSESKGMPSDDVLNQREPEGRVPSEKPDFGYVYNNPGSAKVIPEGYGFENKRAKRISDITDKVSREIQERSKKVQVKFSFRRPGSNVWSFRANDYRVYLWAKPKEGQETVADSNIRVACSCDFWKYQGPEYWAKTEGYLWGLPKGAATPPKVRDPKGRNRVCKHVIAVFQEVSKQNVGQYRFSSIEDPYDLKYLADKISHYRVAKVRVGWKIVGYKEGTLVSLADGREYPGRIGSYSKAPNGLYLGYPKQFVLDYYTEMSEYDDALLTYEYTDEDIHPRSKHPDNNREGEVIVKKAKLIKVEVL